MPEAIAPKIGKQLQGEPAVQKLLMIRGALDHMERSKAEALSRLLAAIYDQALRMENDPEEFAGVIGHPDWSNSKVSTEICDRVDYLRIATRMAVGLVGRRAKSQAEKYCTAMRPFFLRRDSANAVKRSLGKHGIAKMVALGRQEGRKRAILVIKPSDFVVNRLSENPSGTYFLACVRMIRSEEADAAQIEIVGRALVPFGTRLPTPRVT